MTVAEKMAEEQSIRLSYIIEMIGGEVNAIHLRDSLTELICSVAERGREHFSHLITQIVAMGDPDLSRVINLIEQDKWEEEEL